MSHSYSEVQLIPHTERKIEIRSLYENLFFVSSLFDEATGPMIIYNNSPLDDESIERLNLRVFSFLMQGSEFGPSNFAKLRGIVQIPQTDYYTSAIDILVKKMDQKTMTEIYVPLIIYLIFPKKDIVKYAKIVDDIESFISKSFERGFIGTPDLRTIELLIEKLQKKIYSVR